MHVFPQNDHLPIRHLAAAFNNTSATYKFYWLLAILDQVQHNQQEIRKRDLFASMMAHSWYTVNYFQVSFGRQDLIQDTVRRLKDLEGIAVDAPKDAIRTQLMASHNSETTRLLFHFDKNVPHWLLSPWYPKKAKSEIYRLSQINANQPLYRLFPEHIVINGDWADYLSRHIRIIRDYVYWNLTLFLQFRNPNVPDIPNKLIKPAERGSLLKQRKFWDYVMDCSGPIRCIYTGKTLAKGQYDVEHFIPYSFVSHNQIWNLIPADRSFNSVKNNRLPRLEQHFDAFYTLQTQALNTFLRNKPEERLLEDYLLIGADLHQGLSRQKFYEVIQPLVTIASNNGFTFMPPDPTPSLI